MLKKTLVILRIVAVAGIICFFVYSHFSSPGLELFVISLWLLPSMFVILLGLTAWIEAINTSLHPLSLTDVKKRNIKAVIGLAVVAVLAVISLLFL